MMAFRTSHLNLDHATAMAVRTHTLCVYHDVFLMKEWIDSNRSFGLMMRRSPSIKDYLRRECERWAKRNGKLCFPSRNFVLITHMEPTSPHSMWIAVFRNKHELNLAVREASVGLIMEL